MYTAIDRFLWGICMGMGWIVGSNLISFIGQFLHK